MNAPFRFAMLIVTIVTIIENGTIVGLAVFSREVRQLPQSSLIVSMGVADLLIGLIVMPLALYYEFNIIWELGLIVCDFWISADIMCSTASILSIAFISIDKYFSLIHSSRYFGRERLRWVRLFVGVTWATATFVAFSAGASGWARAKPLPPRDFHADLDQVIADWPLRVNFTNISLRQALEYVENLESETSTPETDNECTITNNPIFALYSGMVSFYLPATAILYFSCKIRWISELTLARHERITSQRMKMMKSRAMRRKSSLFAITGQDASDEEEEEGFSIVEDDEAAYQEGQSTSSQPGTRQRRSAMGLRAVAPQSFRDRHQSRRAGILQAAEAAFADELFSEESLTHRELSSVGEMESLPEVCVSGGEVPQNSMVTCQSYSSLGVPGGPQRAVVGRCGSSAEMHADRAKHHPDQDRWFRRLYSATVKTARSSGNSHPTAPPSSQPSHPSHPNLSVQPSIESSPLNHSNRKRIYRQRSGVTSNCPTCGCGPDLPSSIRYIDETSFSERPTREGPQLSGSSRVVLSRRSSSRRKSPCSLRRCPACPATNFFDELSLRFIDESTVASIPRGEIAADLLPLPALPPGAIVSTAPFSRLSPTVPNGIAPDFQAKPSPTLSYQVSRNAPTEFHLLEPKNRRSTGGSSVRKRALSVLSRLKSYHPNLNLKHQDNLPFNTDPMQHVGHPGPLRRRLSRLSTRLKNVDAGGHLSAIGEYRSYMKALRRKERRTANLWLATVVTFLACWAPFFFCYPLSCFVDVPIELMILLPWLGYANSTINPVLHAFVEPVFLRVMAKFVLRLVPASWL